MRNPDCPKCGKILDTFADDYWCPRCRVKYKKAGVAIVPVEQAITWKGDQQSVPPPPGLLTGSSQPPPPPPPPSPPPNKTISRYKASIVLLIISLLVAIAVGVSYNDPIEIVVIALNCFFLMLPWQGILIAKKGEPEVQTPHYGPYQRQVGTQTDGRYVYKVMQVEQNHYFGGIRIRFARFCGLFYAFWIIAFVGLFSLIAAATLEGPYDLIPGGIAVISGLVALDGAFADPLARAYGTNFWGFESFSDSASDRARAHARLIALGWSKEETPEPARIREIQKVRCQYCGELHDETDTKCPNCGAAT